MRKPLLYPPVPEPDRKDMASRATVPAAVAPAVGGRFPDEEIEQAHVFDAKTGQWMGER